MDEGGGATQAPPPRPGAYLRGHVILVGLPGAGKTTVGRLLAGMLRRPFLDFDEEIVRRSGRSVAEIFAREGEAGFRALEADLTRELALATPSVLSPGGGWVTQRALVELLRPPAVLMHLKVSPATAIARMGVGAADRPLLRRADPLAAAVTLWESRRAAYEAADFEVDTEGLAAKEVAHEAARLIGQSA